MASWILLTVEMMSGARSTAVLAVGPAFTAASMRRMRAAKSSSLGLDGGVGVGGGRIVARVTVKVNVESNVSVVASSRNGKDNGQQNEGAQAGQASLSQNGYEGGCLNFDAGCWLLAAGCWPRTASRKACLGHRVLQRIVAGRVWGFRGGC